MKADKDGMFFSCLPSSVLQVKLLHLASPPDAMEKHSPTARGRLPPFVFMPVGEHERISMATSIVAVTFSWNSCFLSFFLVRTQPAISSLASLPPQPPVSSSTVDNDFAAPATPPSVCFVFHRIFTGHFSAWDDFAGSDVQSHGGL